MTDIAYIIKNNLPNREENERYSLFSLTRQSADNFIKQIVCELMERYSIRDTFYRNEEDKPLRCRIQVEVEGFVYYVELYKDTQPNLFSSAEDTYFEVL